MFTILLFIVFTSCIFAAPAQNQTSIQWTTYKEEKSLEQFQNTLLNEKLLKFLNECYNTSQLAPYHHTTEIICSMYFDGILQLNSSGIVVDRSTVLKLLDQTNKTDAFCEQKHNFPTKKYFLSFKQMDLNNSGKCGHSCLEDGGSTTKPICIFLAWMGDVISKNLTGNIKNIEPKVPPVVPNVTATQPTKVLQVDNSSKVSQKNGVLSNKTIETVQDKTTLDADSKKFAFKLSKVPTKLQSNDSSEKQTNEKKQPIDEGKIDIAVKKQSSDEGEIEKKNKQPLDEVKDDATKHYLDENKGDVTNKFSDEDKVDILDTKKTSDEGKVDIPFTTSNASTQTQNKPVEDAYSSEDNITDEEIGDIEDKKKILITNPDNDQIHSSSQEIIRHDSDATTTTIKKKEDPFHEQSGSNFFTYLLVGMFLCIAMYVSYHNKSKILALVLEGRRGDKGRSGRRKHTAAYRKLDSNLEEAITSSARGRTTQIIY